MLLLPLFLLAAAAPAMQAAPQARPACPATPAPLPAGLKGWARRQPVRAAGTARTATVLPVGSGVAATLLPSVGIAYAAPLRKPDRAGASGGLFAFTVATAGRYRVALGAGAWVDVLSGATVIASAAHGHGPDCSGVRKMVDFDLKPGRYILQIAGSDMAELPMMVARLDASRGG